MVGSVGQSAMHAFNEPPGQPEGAGPGDGDGPLPMDPLVTDPSEVSESMLSFNQH